MTTTIDLFLQSFCHHERKAYKNPQRFDNWILATNGFYAVQVPAHLTVAAKGEGENILNTILNQLKPHYQVKQSIDTEQLRELLKDVPKIKVLIDCPDCNGDGSFWDGDGDLEPTICDKCDGTGVSDAEREEYTSNSAIVLNGVSFPPQTMEKLLLAADFFKVPVIQNDYRNDNGVNRFTLGKDCFFYAVPVYPRDDCHYLPYEGTPLSYSAMTLNSWIVKGEVGTSSKTMWAALTGAVRGGGMGMDFNVPQDPDDFRRCRLLVQQCQVNAVELQQVKTVFPWWAPFIDNWDELNRLYLLEAHTGKCEQLYDYMQPMIEQARLLAGWEKTGANSWIRKSQKI